MFDGSLDTLGDNFIWFNSQILYQIKLCKQCLDIEESAINDDLGAADKRCLIRK